MWGRRIAAATKASGVTTATEWMFSKIPEMRLTCTCGPPLSLIKARELDKVLADGGTFVVCQKLIQCTHVLFVFVLLYFFASFKI